MENQFAENLKELRMEKGLGQAQLARAIGVSNGIVSLWENKKREPTMGSLIALAKYFNVSLDYITGLEQQEKRN
ncbi:MAG: helix-turn-helix transcriptional regulator [Clostridia bacterium]|nr:helix-turn-helix transcriptional regulator [Clostridia bacterium]